ncbi:MAG: ABC transporter ATP-binding protein/permease [Pirellulales bacterium]
MKRLNRRLWFRFFRLAKKYWTEGEHVKAWGLLLLLVGLLLGYTYFSIRFNEQTGEFTSALAKLDEDRFWKSIKIFVVLLVCAVPLNAFYYFIRDRLANSWRRWLTDFMQRKYFSDRSFYTLQDNTKIDNPDQRIAEDVNTFTKNSIGFLLVFIEAFLQLIGFSSVLWVISHELVYFLAIYATVGTLVTVGVFGRILTGLNFLQLKKEADFRFSLIRVRENAESIAFYQGERLESSQIKLKFQDVFANMNKLIKWQFFLNMFLYAFDYSTYIVPAVVLAPAVLAKEIEVGTVVQAAGAFAAILKALAVFIEKFDELSKFAAGVNRLDGFVQAIDPTYAERAGTLVKPEEPPALIERARGDAIDIDDVTLLTPDRRRTLIENLSAVIQPGDNLIISGASGGGKSSLLRGIAGLWNAGTGKIASPELGDMMFLPQQPYMSLGNLRQQLIYPRVEAEITDEQLGELLKQVNLPDMVERVGGFDSVHDFGKMLSLGEQQRLSIARLLSDKPKYAILDEATSALDRKNEAAIYQLLVDSGITLVSVCHHPEVAKFHKHALELTGDGGWKLGPATEAELAKHT